MKGRKGEKAKRVKGKNQKANNCLVNDPFSPFPLFPVSPEHFQKKGQFI
jgi:hypothetical protein